MKTMWTVLSVMCVTMLVGCSSGSSTPSTKETVKVTVDGTKKEATVKTDGGLPVVPSSNGVKTAAMDLVAVTKAKPYPLAVCIVSDEKLGEMGDPVVINFKGQEVKFCCDKCKPKFEKDPDTFLKKLVEAKPAAK